MAHETRLGIAGFDPHAKLRADSGAVPGRAPARAGNPARPFIALAP